MEDLESYLGGGSPSTSVEQALLEASAILKQLQRRDFTAAQQRADRELAEALLLQQRVRALVPNDTALGPTRARLGELRDRMEDMRRHIVYARGNTTEVGVLREMS